MAATTRPDNRPETDAHTRHFYEWYVEAAQHTGNGLWDRANKVTHGYVAYLAQAVKNFVTKGTTESVVFGYWAMFSLFPLVTLGVVVASFALGPESARAGVYSALNQFVPGSGSTLIRQNIDQAINQRGGFGIIGVLGLVYGAVGLFTNLQWNLSRIFRDERQRSLPIQILIGLVMMIMLAALIVTSIAASFFFNVVGSEVIGAQSPLIQISALLLPIPLDTLMFGMLFRLVPQRKISWRALWPAAIFAAIAWELSKNLFGWYVANLANFGLVYGGLATVHCHFCVGYFHLH